jgi:hypothetical protein
MDGSPPREATLLYALHLAGAIGLCAGCFAAIVATRIPTHRAKLEKLGGGLVIASLALLGSCYAIV